MTLTQAINAIRRALPMTAFAVCYVSLFAIVILS